MGTIRGCVASALPADPSMGGTADPPVFGETTGKMPVLLARDWFASVMSTSRVASRFRPSRVVKRTKRWRWLWTGGALGQGSSR
jgi:hypothetical protein